MSGALNVMLSGGSAIISISPASITKVGSGELVTTDIPAVATVSGAALPLSYSWGQRSGSSRIYAVSGGSSSTYFRVSDNLLPTDSFTAVFGLTVFDANGVRSDSVETVAVTIKGPSA